MTTYEPGTYRVGHHHTGRTIIRVGSSRIMTPEGRRPDDQLIAHVDSAAPAGWAHEVCTLLNGEGAAPGYALAIQVLRGVAARSGSDAARWAADYLEADPDRHLTHGAAEPCPEPGVHALDGDAPSGPREEFVLLDPAQHAAARDAWLARAARAARAAREDAPSGPLSAPVSDQAGPARGSGCAEAPQADLEPIEYDASTYEDLAAGHRRYVRPDGSTRLEPWEGP